MSELETAYEALRRAALAYPETAEESPWGERVAKVNRKVFVFYGLSAKAFSCTFKLPETGQMALGLPFVEPTGYGLGKSGWVTARFAPGEDVPAELLLEWLEESFRAVAPKRAIKAWEAGEQAAPAARPTARGAVVLVCDDALRAERGLAELRARGLKAKTLDIEGAQARPPRSGLVVVDLGRLAPAGREVALDAVERGLEVAFVGVRDARAERTAMREVPGARAFLRGAPGEAGVVDGVVGLFGGAPKKKAAKKKAAKKKAAKKKATKKK